MEELEAGEREEEQARQRIGAVELDIAWRRREGQSRRPRRSSGAPSLSPSSSTSSFPECWIDNSGGILQKARKRGINRRRKGD